MANNEKKRKKKREFAVRMINDVKEKKQGKKRFIVVMKQRELAIKN